MFGLPAVELSTRCGAATVCGSARWWRRSGWCSSCSAWCAPGGRCVAPFAVGGYIAAAYFFTSSTSFANPAVTFARMFSNTFAGIAPSSVPGFIAFQVVGAVIAFGAIKILFPDMAGVADEVVVPHADAIDARRGRGRQRLRSGMPHLLVIGGSDAGISASLRARELDPSVDVTMVVADAYPNFSICGIPFYVSGETPDWHQLAHRTREEIEATGLELRLDTRALEVDVEAKDGAVAGTGGR